MGKKLNQDQLYQNYINEGGNGLSGIRSTIDGTPIETIGSIQDIHRLQQRQNYETSTQQGVQPISDIYGQTDFGESYYDVDISTGSQLQDIEDTRSKIQPFVHKLGAGLATFAGKTVTATAGGTIGALVGAYEVLSHGELNKFYNNDFQH